MASLPLAGGEGNIPSPITTPLELHSLALRALSFVWTHSVIDGLAPVFSADINLLTYLLDVIFSERELHYVSTGVWASWACPGDVGWGSYNPQARDNFLRYWEYNVQCYADSTGQFPQHCWQ